MTPAVDLKRLVEALFHASMQGIDVSKSHLPQAATTIDDVLSRKRMHIGQIDRSGRGVANVSHHVRRLDALLSQKLCQGRRGRRLYIVKLSEAVFALVIIRQSPPIGVHIGPTSSVAKTGPVQIEGQSLAAIHA